MNKKYLATFLIFFSFTLGLVLLLNYKNSNAEETECMLSQVYDKVQAKCVAIYGIVSSEVREKLLACWKIVEDKLRDVPGSFERTLEYDKGHDKCSQEALTLHVSGQQPVQNIDVPDINNSTNDPTTNIKTETKTEKDASGSGLGVDIEQQGNTKVLVYRKDRPLNLAMSDGFVMQDGDVIAMPGGENQQDRVKIRFSGGGVITLFPGSEIRMGTSELVAVGNTLIFLNFGKIKIVDDTTNSIGIRTKTLIVDPKGTTYAVSYDESKLESGVAVLEGSVNVTPTNTGLATTVVSANQELMVSQNTMTPAVPLSQESKKLFEEATSVEELTSGSAKKIAVVVTAIVAVLILKRYRGKV
jgi:hypothetical protein